MKKAILVIVATGLMGCSVGMQQKMAEKQLNNKYAGSKDDAALIKVVSFDTGCAADQIKVLNRDDSAGFGMYNVNACGKELKYKRTGTVYHAADKSPY
jgi:hypothetical protein